MNIWAYRQLIANRKLSAVGANLNDNAGSLMA